MKIFIRYSFQFYLLLWYAYLEQKIKNKMKTLDFNMIFQKYF